MAYKLSERARTGLRQIKSNPQTASRLVNTARAKSAEKQFMDGYNASKARAAEEAAMRAERIRSNRDNTRTLKNKATLQSAFENATMWANEKKSKPKKMVPYKRK